MSAPIVQSQLGVTLLGAGAVDAGSVSDLLTIAPVLVAADGGADRAMWLGLTPDAVIGDLDSLSSAARDAAQARGVLHPIAEQDSTDFDKCLRNIDAPFVLALGFTAPQIDHTLAVFTVLARRPASRCLVIGAADVCFLAPPVLDMDVPAGTRFSLFPMGPVTGTSTGLRWPIDGIRFAPNGRIGTSNIAESGRQCLRFDAAQMLVILPVAMLPNAIRALVPER